MLNKTLLIVFFTFGVLHSYAVLKPQTLQWNEGAVVLQNRKVITGNVCYKHEYALVLIKDNSKIISYPVNEVSSVRYYDKAVNINRYFVKLNTNDQSNNLNISNTLFEVVISGDIQLLRTPMKYIDKYVRKDDLLQNQHSFNYFLVAFGGIYELHEFKSIILPELINLAPQLVEKLIHDNKLNLNNKGDCIRLVEFCNQANIGSGSTLTAL